MSIDASLKVNKIDLIKPWNWTSDLQIDVQDLDLEASIPVKDVINQYGAYSLLSEIDKDDLLEYVHDNNLEDEIIDKWGHEEALSWIGTSDVIAWLEEQGHSVQ